MENMAGTIEQFSMKDLDILKHDDLRKFAVDQGIEIPAEITTKKALVPYLYEILNKPPEVDEQEQLEKETDVEAQTDEDTSDEEPESAEGDPEETNSDQEPDEAEDDVDRYIRTETSNGVLVYDRKNHSAVMERRV